jgi:hypothetical protein
VGCTSCIVEAAVESILAKLSPKEKVLGRGDVWECDVASI